GLPPTAPSRSTRWSLRAPSSTHCTAIDTGSSEKTVSSSITPWRKRTQRPSLMSIAGISSIVSGVVGECRRQAGCALGAPADEVLVELQSVARALLGVELGRENVIPRHRTGQAPSVFANPHAVARHEIGRTS